jgi:hypothetical protein
MKTEIGARSLLFAFALTRCENWPFFLLLLASVRLCCTGGPAPLLAQHGHAQQIAARQFHKPTLCEQRSLLS